ncbi:Semaphorin-1A [Eumeta japonica]|uniref:Semaphorin-1A n=1 Tax=Eumeta variegata TaxID=151549 RepID=A0A4C1TH86_EUMVA|nr:Semaphorin-1A [Eumeta japonica]
MYYCIAAVHADASLTQVGERQMSSAAERRGRSCLFVARSALSLALQALNGTPQSDVTPYESCFYGELYSGTVADFSGMEPIIYREPLQTEPYDSMTLNGRIGIETRNRLGNGSKTKGRAELKTEMGVGSWSEPRPRVGSKPKEDHRNQNHN